MAYEAESVVRSSLDFIEKNLASNLTLEKVSESVFVSHWYFQRLFRFVTGYSVKEYIRQRRLSEAGKEILFSKKNILDIALDHGYESPESFLRAFRKLYQITPSEARKSGRPLSFLPKFELTPRPLEIREEVAKVRRKDVLVMEWNILGVPGQTTMKGGQNFTDITNAWDRFVSEKIWNSIQNRKDEYSIFGIYSDWEENYEFPFLIGCDVMKNSSNDSIQDSKQKNSESKHSPFQLLNIPPARYVVFEVFGNGPEPAIEAWKQIYLKWLPESGLQLNGPDVLDRKFLTSENRLDNRMEIFLPVKD
ncbi:hypothetical protein A0128_03045 [Leptospira tipperaryensis]|uniref:HTH araC/xylS-type domain-containing protein n=1 Tax=Leptospira tipperaryensis TaxID=2564040 RepID=A0A1D7UTI9_9LEPT|nr:AraC family transcriptional regulator [Leptospira tipperaryensis]AOP32932.1 hypothetical protein A0128_03045 [Leptospira tipperaryensis]